MDNEQLSIQWFPGHMAKTRRLMKQCLPLVDMIVEIIDARIPQSSRNPEIERLIGRKPHILLLNKSDTADEKKNKEWVQHYKERGISCLLVDCRTGKGLSSVQSAAREALKTELERRDAKGMAGRPIRMMVVGIPNVGKSSFINRMSSSKRAQVADRPGVTRGKQWIKASNDMDLLDMPGVLWPKFEDPLVGERLAFTGAIKDDILDIEQLAVRLLDILKMDYKGLISARYGVEIHEEEDAYVLLQNIGRKRGMLLPGGEIHTERAAIMLLDEFRAGKIGRITLESPKEEDKEW